MAPMTRYFSPDGAVTPDVAEYYARRARGGVGLILTEALSPDREVARNHEDIPWFSGDRRDPWRKVVDDVHESGAAIAPQIWHPGGARDFTFPDAKLGDDLESPSGLWTRYTRRSENDGGGHCRVLSCRRVLHKIAENSRGKRARSYPR